MVKNVLQYVETSSQAKRLQSLKESSATDGPEGTVPNKMFKNPLNIELKEVHKFHQNHQHRGLVITSRFQRDIKYESTLDTSRRKSACHDTCCETSLP